MHTAEDAKNNVRVRIAPSPTGPFHLGTARTALFNYLFARKHDVVFVLRIEDTDKERSEKKWEENIIEGLKWLGIEWDEGPVFVPERSEGLQKRGSAVALAQAETIGNYGPYRQSERTEIYKRYIEKLLNEGKAFYCWHTSEELEKEKKEQEDRHEAPRHTCAFRDTKEQDVEAPQKQQGIIRIKNDADAISFEDLIRGKITFDMRLLGDFSIAKNLTEPLYNFAAVVDDFEMRISHVIRGEDHISNTPKQIFLQQVMGMPSPIYAHLPLILGPDRSKLSKRHGATALLEYRDMGYLPEALCNFTAFLGWNPDTDEEVLSRDALISLFDIAKVQPSGAIFNVEKLDWMNGMYIRKMGIEELTMRCVPYLIRAGLIK